MFRIDIHALAWTGAIGSALLLVAALGIASPVSVGMITLIAVAIVATEVAL